MAWAIRGLGLCGAAAFLAGAGAADAAPLTISLTGQSMLRADTRAVAPAAMPAMQALLKADVKFTNFEVVIAKDKPLTGPKYIAAPPGALDTLTEAGFNLLSLANNHAFDLGAEGVQNNLSETRARGIVFAGLGDNLDQASAPAYLHTANGTVALVASASGMVAKGGAATASTPGVNELRIMAGDKQNEANQELPPKPENAPNKEDAARILKNIREARAHADVVIVYQHNHVFENHPFTTVFGEGMPERLKPPAWLVKWSHQEIDAGADIVVMHGAPLLHGIEMYKGKPIFYDLGGFFYNVSPLSLDITEPMCFESAVATLTYDGKKLQSVTLTPVALNPIGEGVPDVKSPYENNQFLQTRGLPSAATGLKGTYILQRIADMSKPFNTKVVVKGDTAEIRLGR